MRIEFALPHALTEAFKDRLTIDELKAAVMEGELIEDYDTRALLFALTIPDRIPYHVVVEYFSGEPVATVVTTYIPDTDHWEPDWKRRKKPRRGSRVEVIISRIPAHVCPTCNQSFLDEEIARRVASLLRPFHGTRGNVPDLPPAKIYIDFEEAGNTQKAA